MFFHMSLWLNLSREDDGTLPYENEQLFVLLTLTEVMLLMYIFEIHYTVLCAHVHAWYINVWLLRHVF